MSKITFKTNLFGELEFDEDDMNKDILMDIDGRKIETTLWLWEDLISEQNHNIVLTFLKFINSIPNLYKMAKKEIESNYMEDEVIKFFIESQIDEIEEDELLVFCFNEKMKIKYIAHES